MRSLKILFSGAAPLKKDLILAVRARMEKQGTDIRFPQGGYIRLVPSDY